MKQKLVILFGGVSPEHDVSCMTAVNVFSAVDESLYDVSLVGITKQGEFVLAEPPVSGSVTAVGVKLDFLYFLESLDEPVVIPLLHGPNGEDGTIQGLLEIADVAYVGPGVLSAAVTMDKAIARTLVSSTSIKQVPWFSLREVEYLADPSLVVSRLYELFGFPCFVKPANMGSSIGISKVSSSEKIHEAIVEAFRYDELLVIEQAAVDPLEIEVAVLGNDPYIVSVPGLVVPGAEFYDYEDKYENGLSQETIPAPLSDAEVYEVQDLAGFAAELFRVEGMARVDFLYERSGRGFLLSEVNAIPGFTPISMFPKLFAASGISYPELVDKLVLLAIERYDRRRQKRFAW